MLSRYPEGVGGTPRKNTKSPETTSSTEKSPERPKERRISRERAKEILEGMSKELAKRQNDYLAKEFGMVKPMFDEECAIDMGGFQPDPFSSEDVYDDRKEALRMEKMWAKAEPPDTKGRHRDEDLEAFKTERTLLLQELNLKDSDDKKELILINAALLKHFREKQKRASSTHLEQSLTILFGKVFGNRLIVGHSAKPDDYNTKTKHGPGKAGVDRVIIDTLSGEVLCTIDDVAGAPGNAREHRKNIDTHHDNTTGGKNIRYGFKIAKDESGTKKIVRSELKNIPVFYIGFDYERLNDLIETFGENPSLGAPVSEEQKKLCQEILRKLIGQANNINNLPAHENEVDFKAVKDRSEKLENVMTELLKTITPKKPN